MTLPAASNSDTKLPFGVTISDPGSNTIQSHGNDVCCVQDLSSWHHKCLPLVVETSVWLNLGNVLVVYLCHFVLLEKNDIDLTFDLIYYCTVKSSLYGWNIDAPGLLLYSFDVSMKPSQSGTFMTHQTTYYLKPCEWKWLDTSRKYTYSKYPEHLYQSRSMHTWLLRTGNS